MSSPVAHETPSLPAAPSHQMVLLEIIPGYREIIKGPKTHMEMCVGHVMLLPPALGEIMGETGFGDFLLVQLVSSPADPPPPLHELCQGR